MSFARATLAVVTKCNSILDAIEQPVSPGFARVLNQAAWVPADVKMHSSPLMQHPALYRLQISLLSAVYVACGGVALPDSADAGPRRANIGSWS